MSPDRNPEDRRFQKEPIDLRLQVAQIIAYRVRYALTCYPNYSSFAELGSLKEFSGSLFRKGLEIVNEEAWRGEESPTPLRIPPYPGEIFFEQTTEDKPQELGTLECMLDRPTIDALLDFLNRIGEKWPPNQLPPQHISEKLLMRGLDYLGFEAWEEADKHDR